MRRDTEWDRRTVTEIIDQLKHKPGALLPVLHGIQDGLGYIPPDSVALVAERLNLSRAEVHGVISFYHHFRTSPPGRHRVEVCRAESCQALGARRLETHVKQRLGIDYHQTTPDGEFSLEPVYCLGNCACSPSIRVGDEIFGRMDEQAFDELLDECQTVAVEVK